MRRGILLLFILFSSNQINAQFSGGAINGWFNTDEFIVNNAILGNDFLKHELLFPDSSVKYKDENGSVKPFSAYSVGHIFDIQHENWAAVPSNPNFPIQIINASMCSFILDSIKVKYFYKRGIRDSSIIDTVFMYHYNNFDNQQIVKWDNTVGFNDTMAAATPYPFNYNKKHGEDFFRVDTILLADKDTTFNNKFSYIVSSVSEYFEAYKEPYLTQRGLFGFSIIYKPGSAYSQKDTFTLDKGDSVSNRVNLFGVYSTQLKLPVSLMSRNYAENSLFLNYKNAYCSNYKGIKGFIPGTGLDSAKYLHCGAFITAPSCTLSVKEYKKTKNAYIKSIAPNPIQSGIGVNVSIKNKQAAFFRLELRDILGKILISKPIFCENDSETDLFFDNLETLNSGIYYLVLKDKLSQTLIDSEKIIISK